MSDIHWQDVDGEIEIDVLDLSMLRVKVFDINGKHSDTFYLCKSDVISLINFLTEREKEMIFMDHVEEE